MTLQRVWLWGVAIVCLLLLIAAWGCTASIRPFPLPLDETIATYILGQGIQDCGDASILVSFVEKDTHRYVLISSEPNPQTAIARWAVIEVTDDPTKGYLWQGTATVGGPVRVLSGHPFAIPDHPDLCQLVAEKTPV